MLEGRLVPVGAPVETDPSAVGPLASCGIGAPNPTPCPFGIAVHPSGSLLVTNHAFATMIPSNFTVLDVYVGDKGSPLSKPDLP